MSSGFFAPSTSPSSSSVSTGLLLLALFSLYSPYPDPAGTSNKLFEFSSTDLDSLLRRRSDVSGQPSSAYGTIYLIFHPQFQGERDLKTSIDFSHDGARSGHGKSNGISGDSDDDDDDSDGPVSGSKSANKRRASGTKSRPARNGGLSGVQEEVRGCFSPAILFIDTSCRNPILTN
jgi:hypothetical protein